MREERGAEAEGSLPLLGAAADEDDGNRTMGLMLAQEAEEVEARRRTTISEHDEQVDASTRQEAHRRECVRGLLDVHVERSVERCGHARPDVVGTAHGKHAATHGERRLLRANSRAALANIAA